ncbi:uncharacterized protein LOC141851862 [Brevipalpus obovatus]|uniref:uncharacterized protein LOC141851862 n=1 Tax=Brevipalpus obovatus TaxID=246614 RepID=UPI003D9F689D
MTCWNIYLFLVYILSNDLFAFCSTVNVFPSSSSRTDLFAKPHHLMLNAVFNQNRIETAASNATKSRIERVRRSSPQDYRYRQRSARRSDLLHRDQVDFDDDPPPIPLIEADMKRLRWNIVHHFSNVRNSFANLTSKENVQNVIIDKFVKLRLETWTHRFNATEMKFLNLPVVEGLNIISILPGSSRSSDQESFILIGAHYDTVLLSKGINDNGSGMSCLLEIARLLTTHKCRLKSTIIFAAFDMEEYGGLGSRHFVHEYLIPVHLSGPRARFKGAFILDTLLNFDTFPNSQDVPSDIQRVKRYWGMADSMDTLVGDFIAIYARKSIDSGLALAYERHWASRVSASGLHLSSPPSLHSTGHSPFNVPKRRSRIARPSSSAVGASVSAAPFGYKLATIEIPSLPSEMPNVETLSDHVNFLRGDHVMFWYHNSSIHKPTLKAIFFTDTGPFRGFMRSCYHESCDDLSILTEKNLKFLKLQVEVLTDTVLDIGHGLCKSPRVAKKPSSPSVRSSKSSSISRFRASDWTTSLVIPLIFILLTRPLGNILSSPPSISSTSWTHS